MDFQPLPLHDAIDERAYDVLLALLQAWHTRQSITAPTREQARGTALINRLWEAAKLASPGPQARISKVVPIVYDKMRGLADQALEEYREELARSEPDGIHHARKAAKAAAIAVILERCAPVPRHDATRSEWESRYYKDQRERWEKELDAWSWVGRRADGLARDLTAFDLRIKPGSVRVLKHRQRMTVG